VMVGMLYRRLNATDTAGADGEARVVEDRKVGVQWSIDEADGSVVFSGIAAELSLPWSEPAVQVTHDHLVVFPRTFVTESTVRAMREQGRERTVASVVPEDAQLPELSGETLILRCPDRLPDIDRIIEEKLLSARLARG